MFRLRSTGSSHLSAFECCFVSVYVELLASNLQGKENDNVSHETSRTYFKDCIERK